MVFSFEYLRTHYRSHENKATQANRRPRTSKRWERQNSNAAATATAAPHTSAYPKSNSACSLHSTGAAGKRDIQRLLVDCSTLPNESFTAWQHFLPTNIADRLALRRPVAAPFYRKQTHTANPRHADFLRRNTARIYSAASRQPVCQTQQSAAPLQSSISRRRPYKTKSPTRRTAKGIRLGLAKPRVANTATPSDEVPRFVLRRSMDTKKEPATVAGSLFTKAF